MTPSLQLWVVVVQQNQFVYKYLLPRCYACRHWWAVDVAEHIHAWIAQNHIPMVICTVDIIFVHPPQLNSTLDLKWKAPIWKIRYCSSCSPALCTSGSGFDSQFRRPMCIWFLVPSLRSQVFLGSSGFPPASGLLRWICFPVFHGGDILSWFKICTIGICLAFRRML